MGVDRMFALLPVLWGFGCAGVLGAFAGKELNEYMYGVESDPMLSEIIGAGAGLAALIGWIAYSRSR